MAGLGPQVTATVGLEFISVDLVTAVDVKKTVRFKLLKYSLH